MIESKWSAKKTPTGIFLFLLIAYVSARFILRIFMPAGGSFADWVVFDTIMDVPRAIVAAAAWTYGVRKFGKTEFGLTFTGLILAAIFFILQTSIMAFDGLSRTPYLLQADTFVLLSFSSLLVGLNEEILFRGLGICALRSWLGPVFALWTSTVLFTLFHYGAQPLSEWPAIFFFGLMMGQLRLAGVSLYWLILFHGLYDSLWFVVEGSGGPSYRWLVFGLLSAIGPMGIFIFGPRPVRKMSTLNP